jgi:endonuclease G
MTVRMLMVGVIACGVGVGETAEARSASLALYSPAQRQLSFAACADQFPQRQPLALSLVPASLQPLALCSDHFAVLYSPISKTPLVAVERLNAVLLREAQATTRTDQFYPDLRIPASGRAELADYRGQQPAVDRGHQAPAADAPTLRAMAQTFALSNMVPQAPESNRKAWSAVERATRKFALRARGEVFVFTGPLFDPGHATVGKGRVWKPTRLFKLVYDESAGRAWAYVLPNAAAQVTKPIDYPTFVQQTGLPLLAGLPITGSVRTASN